MEYIRKDQLHCCALCQIVAGNHTPFEVLKQQVDTLKEESKEWWTYENRRSGERAAFVIVAPGEDVLEYNLQVLDFKHTFTFPRRNGYPEGELKMYMKKW